MAYLIALDDGHGMRTAGKRTPPIKKLNDRVIHENEFNRAVIKFLDVELKRCGFDTLLVAPTDDDVPLKNRVEKANKAKANLYVSIHYDAIDGKFDGDDKDPSGFSVYVCPNSSRSKKVADLIIIHLANGTMQKSRGIIESNLYVLRKTKMPAILSECGFMDNEREALLMINEDFQKEVAKEHAQGICEYFGVTYKEEKIIFIRCKLECLKARLMQPT